MGAVVWFALVGVRMDHSLGRGVRDMSFFPWPRAALLPGLRLVSVQRCYWTVYRLLAGGILEPRACFQFNFRGLLQWTGRAEGQKTQLHRHMVSDLSDLGYLFSLKRVRDKRATGGSDQQFLLSTVLGKLDFSALFRKRSLKMTGLCWPLKAIFRNVFHFSMLNVKSLNAAQSGPALPSLFKVRGIREDR